MKRRAAALCGAAAVLAGMVTAAPAGASAASAPPSAKPAWKKCATPDRPKLQCASLKVPLDHDDPGGRQITLALSRIPHTAKTSQGPLLVNPGGPGGSGRSLAAFVASALPKKVAARYDVIGFDPRGVGASRPALDCRPGQAAPVRADSVPLTPAVERAGLDRAAAFARACAEKHGDLLPHMDTVSAARDMEAIRRALGAPRLNYFGYSYGTYLGAVYARLFPERVRRWVLDSVVDPTGVWYDSNLQQDHAFDDRHRAFLAWVARHHSTYRLGKDPAAVEAAWYRMRAAVAKKPVGRKVGAAELEDTFIPGGYYDGYWPHLAAAFSSFVKQKKTGPLVKAYENFAAVDSAGDNGYSVYAAVQCRDAPWPRDWNTWRADNWAAHHKSPFMTWNNAWYNAPCAFWRVPPRQPVDVTNRDLPPVLLFQATHDAATPYQGAVTLHRMLRRSSLVVENGGGNHGVTLSGNACLDKHLAAYLTDGTVPRGTGRGRADALCDRLPDPAPLKTPSKMSGSARGAALHGLLGFRN